MRFRLSRIAITVTAATMLAACTPAGSGAPEPTSSAAPTARVEQGGSVVELTMTPGDRALATQFAAMRSWDWCAMHDIPAATRITGFEPDVLAPQLDGCQLRLATPNRPWLDLTIGAVPMESSPGSSVTGNAGPLPTVPDGNDMCSSQYPLEEVGDERWAIEISWRAGGRRDAGEKPPCEVVRDYVTAVFPRLTDPPLRSAGLTTPPLALADVDPCTVLAALLPTAIGETPTTENTYSAVLSPLDCAATVHGQSRSTSVSVSIGIDTNILLSGVNPVAGRSAYIEPGDEVCGDGISTIEFQTSDVELDRSTGDRHPEVETMSIDVSDCPHPQPLTGLAERAAQLVPPTPPANPGAQPLGVLDP